MKEDKIEILENKLKNLTYIVVLGFIIIGLLVIGLYFKGNSKETVKTPTSNSGTTGTTKVNYDVSAMKKLSGEEATKLFEDKGTHFLYIGRPGCGICVNLVPELNTVIKDLKITLNYIEVASNFTNEYKDLFKHLDIETSISGEKGTYGELLKKHGYTPIVVVIKDGKMVDAFVGHREAETIKTLFKKYI